MEKKIKGAKSLFRPLEEYDFGKSVVIFGKKKYSYNVNSVLTKNCVKKVLEELQKIYVFARTDKAANNVTIIIFYTLYKFSILGYLITSSIVRIRNNT